jgi:hypothetical protein
MYIFQKKSILRKKVRVKKLKAREGRGGGKKLSDIGKYTPLPNTTNICVATKNNYHIYTSMY